MKTASITFEEFIKEVKCLDYKITHILNWENEKDGTKHWYAKVESIYFTPAFIDYLVKYNIGIEPHEKYIIIDY